ncbi:unnamed protein product [Peronospora destructor]|uniref:Histone RNA hairpin-binding protein RNA-binding domain-containing protein n=1 Tax=Peronospora destructor TaxID=86335 RepID=A0AAV0TQA5_9STRA|nr:unnamed protein product [Peronospora destructor]
MKRMADAIDSRSDSKQRESNSNCSGNAPELKRMRCVEDNLKDSGITLVTVKTLADEKETDAHRLAQRQKQIDYGKNTIGYDRYCAQVSKRQRRRGKHPMTPDKTMRIGKKGFDGIVRKWRQALHKYDPPEMTEVTKVPISYDAMAANARTKTVAGDAKIKGKSEQGALMISNGESTTLNKSVEKKPTLVESKLRLPRRSIYEDFGEDNFENDDSDDDLL